MANMTASQAKAYESGVQATYAQLVQALTENGINGLLDVIENYATSDTCDIMAAYYSTRNN